MPAERLPNKFRKRNLLVPKIDKDKRFPSDIEPIEIHVPSIKDLANTINEKGRNCNKKFRQMAEFFYLILRFFMISSTTP